MPWNSPPAWVQSVRRRAVAASSPRWTTTCSAGSRAACPVTRPAAMPSWVSASPSRVAVHRPSRMSATRSVCSASSAIRCETRMTTLPASASRCIRRKRSTDSSWVRAEFGSSNRKTRASRASARPISTRWAMARGTLSMGRSAYSRMARSVSSERSAASSRRTIARVPSRPTIRFWATVRFGKSCGSWCTTATRSRSRAVSQAAPSSSMVPSSAVVSPARILMSVLLPAPFGPGHAEDLAGRRVQVQPVQRAGVAVPLAQAADAQPADAAGSAGAGRRLAVVGAAASLTCAGSG